VIPSAATRMPDTMFNFELKSAQWQLVQIEHILPACVPTKLAGKFGSVMKVTGKDAPGLNLFGLTYCILYP